MLRNRPGGEEGRKTVVFWYQCTCGCTLFSCLPPLLPLTGIFLFLFLNFVSLLREISIDQRTAPAVSPGRKIRRPGLRTRRGYFTTCDGARAPPPTISFLSATSSTKKIVNAPSQRNQSLSGRRIGDLFFFCGAKTRQRPDELELAVGASFINRIWGKKHNTIIHEFSLVFGTVPPWAANSRSERGGLPGRSSGPSSRRRC